MDSEILNESVSKAPSLSGPEQICEDMEGNHKKIELFSELCADGLNFQEMREKISRIVHEMFRLFTNHDLDWTELRSKWGLLV